MASISFQNEQISVQFAPHPEREMGLVLQVTDDVATQIMGSLEELLQNPDSELKMNLVSGWTLYFKMREGDSRQYLSHPETDLWVATCALNRDHFEKLIDQLRQVTSFNLGDLSEIQSLSNLEVRWERK